MVSMGNAALAEKYRVQFGLPEGLVDVTTAAVEAEAAQRAAAHLPLALPPERVMLADCEADLERCAAAAVSLQCVWCARVVAKAEIE